jgi:hypothetical protein
MILQERTPFFAPNETVATRDFHKLIHVTGAISPAYAGDFTLFEVGSFNSDSGLFEALSKGYYNRWNLQGYPALH